MSTSVLTFAPRSLILISPNQVSRNRRLLLSPRAAKSCLHILRSFASLAVLYPLGDVSLLADLQRPVSVRTGGFT